MMRNDHIFEPTAVSRNTYAELFDLDRDLHERLAPVYKRLNG
jgi:xylulokinase